MHPESRDEMRRILRDYAGEKPKKHLKVLDVGSFDVNGSYREDVEGFGWKYLGADLRDGPNVDVVMPNGQKLPFDDEAFDIVISGSTLEHVERPWKLIAEMSRVLKSDGLLAIITHWQYPVHPYPVDTFRYLPDGLKVLFDETKRLRDYDIEIFNQSDIRGVAYRKSTRTSQRTEG